MCMNSTQVSICLSMFTCCRHFPSQNINYNRHVRQWGEWIQVSARRFSNSAAGELFPSRTSASGRDHLSPPQLVCRRILCWSSPRYHLPLPPLLLVVVSSDGGTQLPSLTCLEKCPRAVRGRVFLHYTPRPRPCGCPLHQPRRAVPRATLVHASRMEYTVCSTTLLVVSPEQNLSSMVILLSYSHR